MGEGVVGAVIRGKVIRFDEMRGYGFIAPESGGDDVFMHVNDLNFDKRLLGQGVQVEFEVEEGDRGLKASGVSLLNRPVSAVTRPAPQRLPDDEPLCDVLTVKELLEEVTENLLQGVPELTGGQLLNIRQRIAQIAHSHGWVES
jgi:cold shock CspA family protein